MQDLSLRTLNRFLRLRIKSRLARAATLKDAVRAFGLSPPYRPPIGGFRSERVGGVPGEWTGAGGGPTLLYLHGGAYFAGSPKHYRPIACAFAAQGFTVFTPAYRLAPRHPFPAALDDVLAVCSALAGRGESIVLAGDSAGGGLALALMIARRDAGAALPAAAALFSPWTDLAVMGGSARENEACDPLFSRRMLKIAARTYLAGARPDDPRASPLYADLRGLPPLLLHVGSNETLRDDSTRFCAQAEKSGVSTRLTLWPDAPHCWQLIAEVLPEARQSIEEAAAFLHEFAGGQTYPQGPEEWGGSRGLRPSGGKNDGGAGVALEISGAAGVGVG